MKSLSSTFIAIAAIVITLAASPVADAAELRLTLANDPISGSGRMDDLYTSETSFELTLPGRRIVFTERMFTNREAGYRFDESWAGVAFEPFDFRGWDATTELGVLHVGKGILGEGVQNKVHRAVGSEEVHLPYIPEESYHPTGSLTLHKQIGTRRSTGFWADGRLDTAPGFRSMLEARIGVSRQLGRHFGVEASAGVRVDHVESEWLENVVENAGPTASASLAWRGFAVTLSHNRYGTRSNHVTLGWRAAWDGLRR